MLRISHPKVILILINIFCGESQPPICSPINEGLTRHVQYGYQTCIATPGLQIFADDPGNRNYAQFIRRFDSGSCKASNQLNRKIPTITYEGVCEASTSTNEGYNSVRDFPLRIGSRQIGRKMSLNEDIKCYQDKWGANNFWDHNGVVCDNIEIVQTTVRYGSDVRPNSNVIRLNFRGDLYNGTVRGVQKTRGFNIPSDPDYCTAGLCPLLTDAEGRRSGAVLITNDFYGPGYFRVRARVPKTADQESGGRGYIFGMWTYYYAEVGVGTSPQYVGGEYEAAFNPSGEVGATIWNQEIDIEIPANGRQLQRGNDLSAMDWGTMNLNTYLTDTFRTGLVDNAFQSTVLRSRSDREEFISKDGEFHDYAFTWFVDPDNPVRNYVRFYFDGRVVGRVNKFVPTRAGSFYIGAIPLWWSSSMVEGGVLNFDTVQIDIAEIDIIPQLRLDVSRVAFPQTYDQDFSGSCSKSCFKRTAFPIEEDRSC